MVKQEVEEIINSAKQVIKIEASQVMYQLKNINRDFSEASLLIKESTGKVIILGVGKSGLIGKKLASTFSSLNIPSLSVHPVELLHGDLGLIKADDIIIILSYSGETEEIKKILPILKNMKVKIIAFTGNINSKLAKYADICINTKVNKEACPYNIVPTSSTTAMLAMGDALGISTSKLKGFKKEDFAKLHPSGQLGKKLNLTVKQIMRQGKDNPVVSFNSKVKNALIVMTSCKLGATSVIDKKYHLVGYFTDGDLRRWLQKDNDILNKKMSTVMTKNPKYVFDDELVSNAKEIMKKNNCDNLPVVDKDLKVIGIIDERDILKEGI